jgi:UDP:flavonoid glycosyltransferase YjiC (YdhE family)
VSRIVLVTGPDPGHALPVLGVARALRSRGHDTVVATGTQHAELVRLEGHRFVELPLLAPTSRDHDFGHVLWRRAGEMAPPLRDLLAPLEPDGVVTDTLTTVGRFVAELLGVPWIEVVPHHLLDPDPLVPPIGMGRPLARTPWRRRSDASIRAAQRRSVEEGHELRDEVRERLGLTALTRAAARLFQTLPGLEPPRSVWPADAHVVGQLAIDPPLQPLPEPDGDAPLIVVTDSTASGLPAPLGAMALDGLRKAGVRVVVTSGRDDLVGWPGATVGRGPHEPLLERAAVAVGPGGGGFVAKALTRGVPLVVVPLAGDQRETAGRVAHSGAGVQVPPDRATPHRLARAVRTVLRDAAFATAARRLADTAVGLGADHAAGIVEAALAGDAPVATAAGGPDSRA